MNGRNLLQTPSDSTKHKFNVYMSGSNRPHPIKRLREDSGTSLPSLDTTEGSSHVDYIRKLTSLEIEVTRLKEENKKLKIEKDFISQEKKLSSLREDEEKKTKRDRTFNQRNTLFEKNKELEEELLNISDEYHTFHKTMSEKNIQLLGEVGLLKTKLLEVSDDLETERRRAAHQKYQMQSKLNNDITDRDCNILKLETKVSSQTNDIEMLTGEVASMRNKVEKYNGLQKSEFNLRMELDSLKNKEIFANIFPKKILKSQQVEEENIRLQRDLANMIDSKEHTDLLKMKLEDAQKEIVALKKKISEYEHYENEQVFMLAELQEWRSIKSDMSITSPSSIKTTVSNLQKDNLNMTSTMETQKCNISRLEHELGELQTLQSELRTRLNSETERYSELRSKYSQCEVKCVEYREDALSCKKLLETYQTATEDEKLHLPRRAGGRILHMKHNPYQDKLDKELKRLTDDNNKLKAQLEAADNMSVIKDYENCQKMLAESENALKKTRTIYQTKVKQFKEGVCDLFGYSITCPADHQYSLLSVFAEAKLDSILFYREEGSMKLIENTYTKTLDMQSHISKLTQHRSIPLFLSDVTSDLFHRQTMIT